jgi:hypothetical protein
MAKAVSVANLAPIEGSQENQRPDLPASTWTIANVKFIDSAASLGDLPLGRTPGEELDRVETWCRASG